MSLLTFFPGTRELLPIDVNARITRYFLGVSFILVILSIILARHAAAQDGAYVEKEGLVVIQAESLEPIGEWVLETTEADFTGAGYLRWNGPNYYGTPGQGTLSYRVLINEPGEYNVRLRMSHMGAPAGDQWNDCWVRMDGGVWAKALHPADKMNDGFTFDSILEPEFGVFENMRYDLTEGEHTLYISGRSENLRLDRIHFYKDYVADPLNLSLPESEKRGAGEEQVEEEGEASASVVISGELKKWHPITLTLDGPEASETGTPNPFLDYRLDVTFTHSGSQYTVPGYFAADGKASETSSTQGNKWRAHFVPGQTGSWEYTISMRKGDNVSVDSNPSAGTPTEQDGLSGSFTVTETDKVGSDHRSKGMLRYVGEHYLQFDNGDYFLKGGANSPENFLAYQDFDSTFSYSNPNYIKSYTNHISDWNEGDPSWKNGRGKGIIGALNYLRSKGMNAVHFITMNLEGDGNDVWPWVHPSERMRYDVSKLGQWDIVFTHMDSTGFMLHLLLQETENELLLDDGALALERKLYYRELISRFGHHQALTWNLGEENDDNTDAQRKAFAYYIRSLDPYDHPIVIHTYPGQQDDVYEPLLGYEHFEGTSLQVSDMADIHEEVLLWRQNSSKSSRPWIVSLDEIGPYQIGVTEDGAGNNHDEVRKQALWATLMAGGAGVEWYFGYDTPHHDLSAEDWRTRDNMWDYTRHALEFFQRYLPFHSMAPMDSLTLSEKDFVLANPGEVYAIYMPGEDSLMIDLTEGSYTVHWYNPRMGGDLQICAQDRVQGPGRQFVGHPPSDRQADWVALLERIDQDDRGEEEDNAEEEVQPLSVVALTLIDADADEDIAELKEGDVIDLAELPPHLNIRAETRVAENQSIQHVILELAPTETWRKEVVAPYALFGDLGGNYLQGTFEQGDNTVTATPYGLDGDPGRAGEALTITFTVVGLNPDTRAVPNSGISEERTLRLSDESNVGRSYTLLANFPNPFNPKTTIPFTVLETSPVRLVIYDMQGRQVQVLVDRVVSAGLHTVEFDAYGIPSGTYFYALEMPGQRLTRKMVLLK